MPRAKLALYVEISKRKCCGNTRRREAGQHKGEQCDKRALRSSQSTNDDVWGNPEKHRQHDDASRRVAICAIYTRYTRDKEIALATAQLTTVGTAAAIVY